jgi:heme-degrading monooxygenase HmoA
MDMNRRTCLQAIATMAATAGVGGVHAQTAQRGAATGASAKPPILLHCDLMVDPAREKEMLNHFHAVFAPAAAKYQGFIDLKLLKLRTIIQGAPLPAGINYRFQLTYQSEELRQKWVNSDTHTKVWAGIEATMKNPKTFPVQLFDVA